MSRKMYHNFELSLFGLYLFASIIFWGNIAFLTKTFIVFCITDMLLMVVYYFWNAGLHYFEKLNLEKKIFFLRYY